MKISELQIIPIKANNGLIAMVNLVYENNLFLGSIGVHKKIDGNGYRLTFPTKKIGAKDFNIYHPINKELSKEIEKEIFEKIKHIFN